MENSVLAWSWRATNGLFGPLRLQNKLTGEAFDQTGTELFRLGLTAPALQSGFGVAIRLEASRVVALASHNGLDWTELATFPRSDFPGEPKLVRLGKMNLHARPENNPGDLGAPGECEISGFSLAGSGAIPADFKFAAGAHEGKVQEFAWPAGTNWVACRIDKGTDQGMSWGPAMALVWEDGKRFLLVGVRDVKPTLNVTTAAGEQILEGKLNGYPTLDLNASDFLILYPPAMSRLAPGSKSGRVADRIGGIALETDLRSRQGVQVHWRAELRNGSSYIRQTMEFKATMGRTMLKKDDQVLSISDPAWKSLHGLELVDVRVPGLQTVGSVPGCPVAGSGLFFGLEMPGAQHSVSRDGARIGLTCELPFTPMENYHYQFGWVSGVAPAGQLRRSFLYYVERERARPSSPFLHYNCWYDLGFSVDAEKMLDVVSNFDREMVQKRGVPVQSYLVDDGWDDPGRGLWAENLEKFPGGLAALSSRMAELNAHLAIWISPMGGYGGNEERTADAQKKGLIPKGTKLDLAYPNYRSWFEDRCLQLMREDGVKAFKWDKAGEGVSPHFMALLDIAKRLRQQNPQVFINVTVGTWPSPFWLNFVDSTWRNGSADVGWFGKGDDREKWLTFRDGECRRMFVQKSPLYPLNSIMAHGIVHGRCFQGEKVGKTGPHLRHEARSYFAIGASLQELYLTPAMMTPEAWDDVADAARWAHANADVLVDSHWVGGDPLKLQPYGYAAWSPRKGTLMLRNPDDQEQTITLDADRVFELPARAVKTYALTSPYPDQRLQALTLVAGQPQIITLQPFEVLVWDAKPVVGKNGER